MGGGHDRAGLAAREARPGAGRQKAHVTGRSRRTTTTGGGIVIGTVVVVVTGTVRVPGPGPLPANRRPADAASAESRVGRIDRPRSRSAFDKAAIGRRIATATVRRTPIWPASAEW